MDNLNTFNIFFRFLCLLLKFIFEFFKSFNLDTLKEI